MIVTDASSHFALLCVRMYEIGGLRIEMFEHRMNSMQRQLAPVGIAFDRLGQEYGIDFEDLWRESASLIVDDARFVIFSGPRQYDELNRRWQAWLSAVIRRIDERRSQTYRVIDASIQIGMVRTFIEFQSVVRAWIVRMSVRLFERLFIDVPCRLRMQDVDGAWRVSANALNTIGSAVRSPLSTINTIPVY